MSSRVVLTAYGDGVQLNPEKAMDLNQCLENHLEIVDVIALNTDPLEINIVVVEESTTDLIASLVAAILELDGDSGDLEVALADFDPNSPTSDPAPFFEKKFDMYHAIDCDDWEDLLKSKVHAHVDILSAQSRITEEGTVLDGKAFSGDQIESLRSALTKKLPVEKIVQIDFGSAKDDGIRVHLNYDKAPDEIELRHIVTEIVKETNVPFVDIHPLVYED